jgi:hypothetical protein
LNNLADLIDDQDAAELISTARFQIHEAVQALSEEFDARDRARREETDRDWDAVLSKLSQDIEPAKTSSPHSRPRSIFDDVDEG